MANKIPHTNEREIDYAHLDDVLSMDEWERLTNTAIEKVRELNQDVAARQPEELSEGAKLFISRLWDSGVMHGQRPEGF